jgi:hypothetical protein
MTIWRTRIACWIPVATHTGCVIHNVFPLQQWFHERASELHYTYIPCLLRFSLVGMDGCVHTFI